MSQPAIHLGTHPSLVHRTKARAHAFLCAMFRILLSVAVFTVTGFPPTIS